MTAPRPKLTPEVVLTAYAQGLFPMAESAEDPALFWVDPRRRGIFPLDGVHVSRSLRKRFRQDAFEVRVDADFTGVMRACAEPTSARPATWINEEILRLYGELHALGYAHSVETWIEDRLVGGLYGVALGGAFFGESMFHRVTDASKVALVHLVARLRRGGFTLLDTQFITPHLMTLGAIEISRAEYRRRLATAIETSAKFYRDLDAAGVALLQSITHTS